MFYHPRQLRASGKDIAWPLPITSIKVDALDFKNLAPVVAATLEILPSRNFHIDGKFYFRGCGHPLTSHFPSGICPVCIINNALSSDHHGRTLETMQPWVKIYCEVFAPNLLKLPTYQKGGIRGWMRALSGCTPLISAEINPIFGLRDTARERIAACELALRARYMHEVKKECDETLEPTIRRLAARKAQDYATELAAAQSALKELSCGIKDVDCECRLVLALNTNWHDIPYNYVPHIEVDHTPIIKHIVETNPESFALRLKTAQAKNQQFPSSEVPLAIPAVLKVNMEHCCNSSNLHVMMCEDSDNSKSFHSVATEVLALEPIQEEDGENMAETTEDEETDDESKIENREEDNFANGRPPTVNSIPAPQRVRRRLQGSSGKNEHTVSFAEDVINSSLDGVHQLESDLTSNTHSDVHQQTEHLEPPAPVAGLIRDESMIQTIFGTSSYENRNDLRLPPKVEFNNKTQDIAEWNTHNFIDEKRNPTLPAYTMLSLLSREQLDGIAFKANAQLYDSALVGSGVSKDCDVIKEINATASPAVVATTLMSQLDDPKKKKQPKKSQTEQEAFFGALGVASKSRPEDVKLELQSQPLVQSDDPESVRMYVPQPELHPFVVHDICAHDAARLDDIETNKRCPQVFCNQSDYLNIGNYELEQGEMSHYGYDRPTVSFEGSATNCSEKTWLVSSFLQLQHAASLANLTLSQNSNVHYLLDAGIEAANLFSRQSRRDPMTPLSLYLLSVIHKIREISREQTATCVEAAEHSKYVLRDALLRHAPEETRSKILAQQFLQGDKIWEDPSTHPDLLHHYTQKLKDMMIYKPPPPTDPLSLPNNIRNRLRLLTKEQIFSHDKVSKERILVEKEPFYDWTVKLEDDTNAYDGEGKRLIMCF